LAMSAPGSHFPLLSSPLSSLSPTCETFDWKKLLGKHLFYLLYLISISERFLET
jgi:hypothetical protein